MKKIILMSLAASSFVFANTIELKMQEFVESKITPTQLSGSIGIQEFGLTQNEVRGKMDLILTAVKKADIDKSCSGGGYSSYPHNEWINNKNVRKGYTANLNLSCKTKSTDEYDLIVNAANAVVSPSGTISQSALSWVTSEKDVNIAISEMKFALVKKAQTSAAEMASEFGWECDVDEINIGGMPSGIRPVPYRGGVMMAAIKMEQDTAAPISQDVSERLSADIVIKCRTNSFDQFEVFRGGDAGLERMNLMQKEQMTKRGAIAESMRIHAAKCCQGKKSLSDDKGAIPHMCPLDKKCEKLKQDRKELKGNLVDGKNKE